MVISRFLLASLNMDAVLSEATIHQRRQVLKRMSKGLGLQDAYETTLDRIRIQGGSKSRLGLQALMWISHSGRPLGSQELCHALGVELGAKDFSIANVPSIRTVLGYTLGLATVDELTSTTRLVHFTLQEYLGEHPTLFVTAHSMMAEICLTYLNCRSVRSLPLDSGQALETTPFLEYSTCFWATHASREVTEPVKSLALRLLDGYENHVSATILWRWEIHESWWREDIQRIHRLHCIVFGGVSEIASSLLEIQGRQMNWRESKGRTLSVWAVEHKNRGVTELQLGQGDIELYTGMDDDGGTVLSFTARKGREGTVKLDIQQRDVLPGSTGGNGRTPLSVDVSGRYESVVKLYLERGDARHHSADIDGRRTLLFAAARGHRPAVMLHLERNPNQSPFLEDQSCIESTLGMQRFRSPSL